MKQCALYVQPGLKEGQDLSPVFQPSLLCSSCSPPCWPYAPLVHYPALCYDCKSHEDVPQLFSMSRSDFSLCDDTIYLISDLSKGRGGKAICISTTNLSGGFLWERIIFIFDLNWNSLALLIALLQVGALVLFNMLLYAGAWKRMGRGAFSFGHLLLHGQWSCKLLS